MEGAGPIAQVALWREHWGDVASVIGLAVGIMGFGVTIWQIRRARSASEAARVAAETMRSQLLAFDATSELSRARTIMEEIKRLHREKAWHAMPDRYQVLRDCLVVIRGSELPLTVEQKATLTACIQQFKTMEQRVERANQTSQAPPSVANLNRIVSEQLEMVSEVLSAVKLQVGR